MGSKRAMRAMPLLPCTSASHIVVMSLPTGVTAPRPVTATRRVEPIARYSRRSTVAHLRAGAPRAVHGALKISEPLVPPRPIEFDSATATFAARALFGT